MDEDKQTRRVTIRLTPYQARRLWKLRSADLPEGARPRTVTEVLVRALLDASRAVDRDEAPVHREEGNGHDTARRDEAIHDERTTAREEAISPPEAALLDEAAEAAHH